MSTIHQIITPLTAAAYLTILSAAIIRMYRCPRDRALLIRLIGAGLCIITPAVMFLLAQVSPLQGLLHDPEASVDGFRPALSHYANTVSQAMITFGFVLFALGELLSAHRDRPAASASTDEPAGAMSTRTQNCPTNDH